MQHCTKIHKTCLTGSDLGVSLLEQMNSEPELDQFIDRTVELLNGQVTRQAVIRILHSNNLKQIASQFISIGDSVSLQGESGPLPHAQLRCVCDALKKEFSAVELTEDGQLLSPYCRTTWDPRRLRFRVNEELQDSVDHLDLITMLRKISKGPTSAQFKHWGNSISSLLANSTKSNNLLLVESVDDMLGHLFNLSKDLRFGYGLFLAKLIDDKFVGSHGLLRVNPPSGGQPSTKTKELVRGNCRKERVYSFELVKREGK